MQSMLDASPLLSVFPFVGVINKVFIHQKKKKHPRSEEINATKKKLKCNINNCPIFCYRARNATIYISSCYTKTSELTSIKHKPIVDK